MHGGKKGCYKEPTIRDAEAEPAMARDFERLWNDSVQRERLLAALRKIEHEPGLIGASSHLLAIGRNAIGRTK